MFDKESYLQFASSSTASRIEEMLLHGLKLHLPPRNHRVGKEGDLSSRVTDLVPGSL